MDVPGWLWAATLVGLVGVITIDLIIVDRRPHPFGPTRRLRWVIFYVALRGAFAVFISAYFGLAVRRAVRGRLPDGVLAQRRQPVRVPGDHGSFAVPPALQHRVLLVGIVIALFLRGS